MREGAPRDPSPIRWIYLPVHIVLFAAEYSLWICWRLLQWTKNRWRAEVHAPTASRNVEVPISSLVELAIDVWRLERWLTNLDGSQSNAAGRFVSRRLGTFLGEFELETVDLTGQPYEPGLALELIGNVSDPTLPPNTVLVDEMIIPLCLWRGKVVRHGQVVTRSSAVSPQRGGKP
jgi:hypothetical protein